jgi:hypothetical protein
MSGELSCTFAEAARKHVLDARQATVQERLEWMFEAMEAGIANARRRVQRGLVAVDGNGEVWWSPELERQWFGDPHAEAGAVIEKAPGT